ncbi:MAG: TfoX/Sxy family protein [Atribacterota bacterium]|nr:TfoX/Sxy family protein [Candidatus Atribacteria bacterium]
MEWKKVPEKNRKILDHAFEVYPEAERKMMFGCPGYFINGNMLAGTHQETFFIRLSEEDQKEIFQKAAAPFTPMVGRTMKGYVTLPASIPENEADFREWLGKGIAYVRTLPPKAKKSGKS